MEYYGWMHSTVDFIHLKKMPTNQIIAIPEILLWSTICGSAQLKMYNPTTYELPTRCAKALKMACEPWIKSHPFQGRTQKSRTRWLPDSERFVVKKQGAEVGLLVLPRNKHVILHERFNRAVFVADLVVKHIGKKATRPYSEKK